MKFGRMLILSLCLSLLTAQSDALTRRGDVDDSAYLALALNSFSFSGLIGGPGWYGSGVLISPNWVLTAKHCLPDGQSMTFTTAGGISRNIAETVLYPSLDFGLARLSTPITDVQPAKLYSLDFGIDQYRDCYISGAGNTGTGETGEISGSGGACRAAQGLAMYSGEVWGWSSTDLLTLFRGNDQDPQEYEGGSAHGDSGGGVYFDIDGNMCVDGVLSYSWTNSGVYGTAGTSGGGFIRTSLYNDWITTYATDAVIIPEPACILALTVAGIAMIRKKNR